MLESLSFSVFKLCQKRQLHVNTDFAVTGWMLCVITHIQKDVKDHSDSDHSKQFNNFIKTLFFGASEEEMAVTQDIFWTKYTDFDNHQKTLNMDVVTPDTYLNIWQKTEDIETHHIHNQS